MCQSHTDLSEQQTYTAATRHLGSNRSRHCSWHGWWLLWLIWPISVALKTLIPSVGMLLSSIVSMSWLPIVLIILGILLLWYTPSETNRDR